MQKTNRRQLFYVLALIFTATAPILIAYSLGYGFNFSTKTVRKTGGIFIKSKIPQLSLFLNGAFAKETSLISGGALLTSIDPGTHILRIEKIDHQTWLKTVDVFPEMVTELRNILLVPQTIPRATSTKEETALILRGEPLTERLHLGKKGNLIFASAGTSTVVASAVNSFGVIGEQVFFVSQQGFIAKFNPADGRTETLGHPGFYLSADPVRFVGSPDGTVMILDSSGGLFSLDTEGRLKAIDSGIKEVWFDGRGRKLLIVKADKIEVLWLSSNQYQPFEKEGTQSTVLSIHAPALSARWFYGDNAHVAIRTDDGIYLTELDGRGGRNTAELISGKTDDIATTSDIPNAVFYKKGKNWYKIGL